MNRPFCASIVADAGAAFSAPADGNVIYAYRGADTADEHDGRPYEAAQNSTPHELSAECTDHLRSIKSASAKSYAARMWCESFRPPPQNKIGMAL